MFREEKYFCQKLEQNRVVNIYAVANLLYFLKYIIKAVLINIKKYWREETD